MRGARPALAEAARRGGAARVGREDGARRSSSRRRRASCGFAAEVAAVLAEKAIFDLQGPVLRVTGYDVPYPYWQIEDAYMPSVERVVDAVRRAARCVVTLHEIPLERRTLHGHFSRDLEPILTVDSGDSIAFSCLNAGWRRRDERALRRADRRRRARRRPRAHRPGRGARRARRPDARGSHRRGSRRAMGRHGRGRLAHAAQRAARRLEGETATLRLDARRGRAASAATRTAGRSRCGRSSA